LGGIGNIILDSNPRNESAFAEASAGQVAGLNFKRTAARAWVPACAGIFAALRKYKVDMREYYVYILASKRNGTLYVVLTNDLAKRVEKHKRDSGSKFVQKYKIHGLVYFEKVIGYREARRRERKLKWWKRKWKLALIEQMNPKWRDLSTDLLGHSRISGVCAVPLGSGSQRALGSSLRYEEC
jgi:putative endonuclease